MKHLFDKRAASAMALGLALAVIAAPSFAQDRSHNRGSWNNHNPLAGRDNRQDTERLTPPPPPQPQPQAQHASDRGHDRNGGDRNGGDRGSGQPAQANNGRPDSGGQDHNRPGNCGGNPRSWDNHYRGQSRPSYGNGGNWNNDPGRQDNDHRNDHRPGNDHGDQGRSGNWNGNRNDGGYRGGDDHRGNDHDWDRGNDRNRDHGWNRGPAPHFDWRSNSHFHGYSGVRYGFYFFPGTGYYRVPSQWYGHHWYAGDYLPDLFYSYRLYDWDYYDLPMPPFGCAWYLIGQDAVLVDIDSGRIIDVYYDIY